MSIRIANAAGFWGDDISAPGRLVRSARVDYLTLEYLAELTMSILAHLRSKDPQTGFATDVLTALRDVLPELKRQSQLRVITNGGGVNPRACALAVSRILVESGLGEQSVAVVEGDDLMGRLPALQHAGCEFAHLDTGEPLGKLAEQVASANVYFGAVPLVEALASGARIVITGRVADASLTVAPVVHEYGWSWHDWDRLAAATVAGHLIECGAQVTGGYAERWQEVELLDLGYPIAEVSETGETVITKPEKSGGIVDRRSVIEQLVYEIGDPKRYNTPDVVADFTTVEVAQIAPDRVQVSGAVGNPAPEDYKVSLAYPSGYTASAQLLVWGRSAEAKARFTGELVARRLRRAGYAPERLYVECLGAGDGVPFERDGTPARSSNLQTALGEGVAEIVLRLSAQDSRREVVERFTREIAPLITSGPSGLAGYAAGRAAVRPVLAYWPALVPKSCIQPHVEVRPAASWCAGGAAQ